MLQVFGFERVSVVLGDLFFIDPDPMEGQETPERGVRLEVRLLHAGELTGSIYAARPIEIAAPVWRADLLESVDSPPGSLDRAHHHPAFRGWGPSQRGFDREQSADPVPWVGRQLADLEGLLTRAGVDHDPVLDADADRLRSWVPEIERALAGLLAGVKSGELARTPVNGDLTSARISWL